MVEASCSEGGEGVINQLLIRYERKKVQGDKSPRGRRYESTNHLVKMYVMSYYEMCTRVQDILVPEVTYWSCDLN